MTVYTKSYSAPPINEKEILRYAGVSSPTEEILALMREAIDECEKKLSYRVCYCEIPLTANGCLIDMSFTQVSSSDLAKNLSGCDCAVLFAATLGIELDRIIVRYSALSPAKALMLQAVGAERIEALCDCFCREIKSQAALENKFTCPRFSPGYGDLDISFQRDIFCLLDCSRKIGLSLNESLLMSPSKSVTAIIGKGKQQ